MFYACTDVKLKCNLPAILSTREMELKRTVSEKSYFLTPHPSKVDRRNYASEKPKALPEACVFVASLSNTKSISQTQQSLSNYFRQFGNVTNIKVSVDKLNRPFAFVQFERKCDAERAMEERNALIGGRTVRIEKAKVDREIQVFIGPTPLAVVEAYLKMYGPIEHINVYDGENGLVLFCKYNYRDDAIAALKQIPLKFGWPTKW